MRRYEKITALDFEMFNTKHYWSICWAGAIVADFKLNEVSSLDMLINPMIKEKFIGHVISLPFDYCDLKDKPTFDLVADKLFEHLEGGLVIGHAIENDLRMIADACKKFNLRLPSFDYIDTNVCYCAFTNTASEQSLSKLAELFEFEFEAHNPVEDARAAFKIIKMLSGDDLYGFLDKYNIEVGSFENGLIRRSYRGNMGVNQSQRLKNYNRIFDAAKMCGNGNGQAYCFNNSLAMEQDLFEVAEALIKSGAKLVVDAFCADFIISNDLYFSPPPYNAVMLKDLAVKFKLNKDKYNFTPKKVTLKDGSVMGYRQYNAMIKKGAIKNGELLGF